MRTAVALCVVIAASVAAAIAAAAGARPGVLGALAVLALLALATAAASAALELGAPGDLEEPREARGPTHPPPLGEPMTRRVFGRLWLGALGALGALGLVPLIALARKPGRAVRTGWVPGTRLVDAQGRPLKLDRLVLGGIETVFPQSAPDAPEAPAVLIRVPPSLLQLPDERRDWAPEGYIAFSKTCTHAGCPVALYREQTHELYCPCHQSIFDVTRLAKNVSGPAPRPLPQLGLDVDDDGYLVARGDFAGAVGPDDWDRTL